MTSIGNKLAQRAAAAGVLSEEPKQKQPLSPQAAADARVTLFVPLPADVVQHYAAEAAARGMDVPALIAERLTDCAEHQRQSGFWVTNEQRQTLSPYLGSDLQSAQQLTALVRSLCAMRLGSPPDAKLEPITLFLDRQMISRAVSAATRDMPVERILREGAEWGVRQRLGL